MPKFMVLASFVSYCEVEIEADNLDEAKDIAYAMDGGQFNHSGYGDWNIDEVAEVEPYTCPKFEPATEEL
jgi:hypothetical protein